MLILLAASLFFSSPSIARFALRRHFSPPKKKRRSRMAAPLRAQRAEYRIQKEGASRPLPAHSSGMKKSSELLSEPSSGR